MKRKTMREVGKVRLELLSAAAMREEAKALDHGNKKPSRSPFNWRVKRVLASDQVGAALRHIGEFTSGHDAEVPHVGDWICRISGSRLGQKAAETIVSPRPLNA